MLRLLLLALAATLVASAQNPLTDAVMARKNIRLSLVRLCPVQGMVNLVSSGNDHYGNMVGCMRAKGIAPPSTTRAKK